MTNDLLVTKSWSSRLPPCSAKSFLSLCQSSNVCLSTEHMFVCGVKLDLEHNRQMIKWHELVCVCVCARPKLLPSFKQPLDMDRQSCF